MSLISIVIKNENERKYISHKCEQSFESFIIDLDILLIPYYLKNYKEFSIGKLFDYIINYSSLYVSDYGINEDAENLCEIDITSPSQIMLTCYDMHSYKPTVMFKKAVNVSGLESTLVDIQLESEDNDDIQCEQPDEIVVEDTVALIDDASDTLFYIRDRNDFVKKVVESNYKKNMSKNEFISILKDFYDIIVSKTKLNI